MAPHAGPVHLLVCLGQLRSRDQVYVPELLVLLVKEACCGLVLVLLGHIWAEQLVHLPALLALDSLSGGGALGNLTLLIRSNQAYLIHLVLAVCHGRCRVSDSVVPGGTLLVAVLVELLSVDDAGLPLLLSVAHDEGLALFLIGCPLMLVLGGVTLLPVDSAAPPLNLLYHLWVLHRFQLDHVGHVFLFLLVDHAADPHLVVDLVNQLPLQCHQVVALPGDVSGVGRGSITVYHEEGVNTKAYGVKSLVYGDLLGHQGLHVLLIDQAHLDLWVNPFPEQC